MSEDYTQYDWASKEDLMRAKLSGMIERWAEYISYYEIQIESDKIEWEGVM